MTKDILREMTGADLDLVLGWRNCPDVRRYMYTSHEISSDEHRAWFERKQADSQSQLLIYERDGVPCGFANLSESSRGAVSAWGFYLSPDAPKGSGRRLGSSVLAHGFAELGLHKLCGEVLAFNVRSIEFHKALGFVEEGRLRDQYHDGESYHDVVCFGLLRSEWENALKGEGL